MFKDINGKEVKVGMRVKRIGWGNKEAIVTSISPCGGYLRYNGEAQGDSAAVKIIDTVCCSLDEAAHVLREAGVNVDEYELYKAKFPRPETLPVHKIRIKSRYSGDIYGLVRVDNNDGFIIFNLAIHIPWDCLIVTGIGSQSAINLADLCEYLEHEYILELVDTWSPKSEFPELVEC